MRLVRIAQKINNSPYITSEELKEYLEQNKDYNFACSVNTIKRDISILRDEFLIDIDYSRRHNGYYIKKDDGGVNPSLSLIEQFDIISALSVVASVPKYIHIEPFKPMGTHHLRTITIATENCKSIVFQYLKYSSTAVSERTISPYAIKQMSGRWYIVGKELEGDIKTFGLDRISELKLSDQPFEPTTNFSMEERFEYSYGIYSDPTYEIEDIVLNFDAEDGRYLKSTPLHHTQKIIKDTANECTVQLRLRVTYDFIMALLSRSNSLKVISPNSLRERVKDIYRSAILRNE